MAESRYLLGVPEARAMKRSKRTLVLWVLLVLLFLAIWQFLSPAPRARRQGPVREEQPLSALESAGIALGGFTTFAGLVFLATRKRLFPAPDPLLDAESNLLHEDYDAAIAKARALLGRKDIHTRVSAVVLLVRVAEMRADFAETIALCERAQGQLGTTSGLYKDQMEPRVHAHCAFALAALGRVDEAESALAKTDHPDAFPGTRQTAALARAVVLARRGKDAELLRHLASVRRSVKKAMSLRQRTLMRTLEAYAKSRLEPAMRVAGQTIDPDLRSWLAAVVPEVVLRMEAR
jgi:hypothetical protein